MKQPSQRHPRAPLGRCPNAWPYRRPQQYNCKRLRPYQQQSPERQPPKPNVPSPSTDSESKHLRFHMPHHKFYQKQKLITKLHHRPLHRHQQRTLYFVSIKRQLVIERGTKLKQGLQVIFDWMMEMASLLKVTKNAFYRAIIIFHRLSQIDPKIINSKRVSHFVCACISLGAKFESSDSSVDKVYLSNARRVSKEDISQAQYYILEFLNWKIPVNVSIEFELCEFVRCWNEYITQIGRSLPARDLDRYHKMLINSSQRTSNKLYIEIVYIIDYLIIKLHADFLRQGSFKVPILMALYIVTSIRVGGMHLDQSNVVWQIFQYFLSSNGLLSEPETQRFKADVQKHFAELRIFQVLGRIPLNLNFQKLIKRSYEQFYLPKIEGSF